MKLKLNKLDARNPSLVDLIRAIRKSYTDMSIFEAKDLAKRLFNGDTIESYYLIEYCIMIVESHVDDDSTRHFKTQQEYFELCKRGAAGDIEAALAYCKLEFEGKVCHSAYA